MTSSLMQVPALKLVQNGVELYLTRLRINDISRLYKVDRFDIEGNAGGDQRALDDSRGRHVKRYIMEERPGKLPAAVVMNCKDAEGMEFKEGRSGVGKLKIPSTLRLLE